MVDAIRSQMSAVVLGILMGVIALVLSFGCTPEPNGTSSSPAGHNPAPTTAPQRDGRADRPVLSP